MIPNDEIAVVWGLGQNESDVSPRKLFLLAQVSIIFDAPKLPLTSVIGTFCRAPSLDYCNCMRQNFHPATLCIHFPNTIVSHLLLYIGGI